MTPLIRLRRTRGSATDVIGRAINNAIANWEPILIASGEMIVGMVIAVLLVMLLFPPLMSAAENGSAHWLSVSSILLMLVTLVVAAAGILLHGFISGATVRTYLDGCRAAMPTAEVPKPPIAAYRAFEFSQWLSYGKALWLRIALVHLVLFAAAAAIVGVIAVVAIWGSGSPTAGCLLVPLTLLVIVPVILGLWLWSQKAIVMAAAFPDVPLGSILSNAWSALEENFGFHFLVALIAAFIGFALSALPFVGSAAASCLNLSTFVALTEPA